MKERLHLHGNIWAFGFLLAFMEFVTLDIPDTTFRSRDKIDLGYLVMIFL
jgi:hypothetical protein